MLQVAFGGYTLLDDNSEMIVDDLHFHEPGYTIMSPLELSVPKADSIYILLRKRDASGVGFENNFISSQISVTAIDATNAEPLSVVTSNSGREEWNDDPSSNTPVLLEITNQISIAAPATLRVRIIDVAIKDLTDNSVLNFRIIVE